MYAKTVPCVALILASIALPAGAAAMAWQEAPMTVQAHIDQAASAAPGTPGGQGLLATARAEAEIAVQHIELAAGNRGDLGAMKLHIGHALNALDPAVVPSGPGLGYGARKAAAGVAERIGFVRDDAEASTRVRTYARYVATSAQNAVERADSIITLGRRILDASSAEEAGALLEEAKPLSDALITGVDANRDGGVGWRRGEAGLEQARQYLAVLKRSSGAV